MTLRPARFLDSISQIDAAQWNALAGTTQPFARHEFLLALEESGCAIQRTGWIPQHLVIEDAGGNAAAAMPLYLKAHSRGEFVFDFSWASAYAQHGLDYYPKLLTAIPFTPVCGPRLLLGNSAEPQAMTKTLIRTAMDYARRAQLSSWHLLFPEAETAAALEDAGLITRRDCQFHWFNQGYESFDGFLTSFTAEKRKKAKRERRRVAEAGIEFDTVMGGEMDAKRWQSVYPFYADTFHRHGHEPYLNLNFFTRVAAAMPNQMMLKIARMGATPIAVAIFFVGADALFGRYWGAGGNYHSLHFETCYYQGIEYCIANKLQRFEPGTQGEHKVPRGFVPSITRSSHYIADKRFAAAIRDFASRESRGVDSYAAAVNEHVPYHRAPDEGVAPLSRLAWLGEHSDPNWFPPLEQALSEPPGLLAAGGDLSPSRLLAAYERGVFPWYSAQQPILWWSPDPRMVLFPSEFKCSRSLQKSIRNSGLSTRLDIAFEDTIRGCAAPRRSGPDTWLNEDMIASYATLHRLGFAHSIETYRNEALVGGLYGIHLGQVFFGESMFSRERDASKIAVARLVEECRQRDIRVIDCQVASDHLASLGAREVSRSRFVTLLRDFARREPRGSWSEISP